MSGLIIIALTVLVFIIIYQIAKAGEYAAILRGEQKMKGIVNSWMAWLLVIFFVLGCYGVYKCHVYMETMMIPESASEQGKGFDSMFRVTVWVTGIVFFITQGLLFWFSFKYKEREGAQSFYFAHNNKLELIWTTIPAIAMASLVAVGLKNWLNITQEAPKEAFVVEIVGKQFNWLIRYPGKDGELGKRDFRKISDVNNVLGLDWTDKHNMDDIISQSGEMHLVVNKPVKLIIGSRDVIHDVGLPHFRLKMDAVPGITTTLWFTPTITTEKMKDITKNTNFVYEISCDQMCGKGHYSMRGTVIVQTQQEYDAWMAQQKSYYATANPSDAPAATPGAAPSSDTTVKAISMK